MSKIKIRWDQSFNQTLDSLTNPNSPFYDEEFTNKMIKQYGSIEEFLKSIFNYESKIKIK
jgi:hypothetical protein